MEYIPYIVLAIVVIAFVIYIIYSTKKKGLKQTALEWILIAESEFQKGHTMRTKKEIKLHIIIKNMYAK